jgi:hypothetical protein
VSATVHACVVHLEQKLSLFSDVFLDVLVAARVRPMPAECKDTSACSVYGRQTSLHADDKEDAFLLDFAFGERTTNAEVFRALTEDVLDTVIDSGATSCIKLSVQ